MFDTLARQHGVEVFSLSLYEIDKRLCDLGERDNIKEIIVLDTRYKIRYNTGKSGLKQMNDHLYQTHRDDLLPSDERRTKAAEIVIAGFSAHDIEKALQPKVYIDPSIKLPKHYYYHLSVFDAKAAETLPSHRPCDHKIELKPGTTPPVGLLYNMSIDKL